MRRVNAFVNSCRPLHGFLRTGPPARINWTQHYLTHWRIFSKTWKCSSSSRMTQPFHLPWGWSARNAEPFHWIRLRLPPTILTSAGVKQVMFVPPNCSTEPQWKIMFVWVKTSWTFCKSLLHDPNPWIKFNARAAFAAKMNKQRGISWTIRKFSYTAELTEIIASEPVVVLTLAGQKPEYYTYSINLPILQTLNLRNGIQSRLCMIGQPGKWDSH